MTRPMLTLMLALAACTGGTTDPNDTDPNDDTGVDTDADTDPDGDTAGDDPVRDNETSSTGDFAGDYIRDTRYDSLLIEVDYVTGHAPSAAALSELTTTLEGLLNKPAGITAMLDDEIPDQGAPTWTTATTRDLEREYRDAYRDPESGEAVLYMLFVDGDYENDEGNARILGYAYQGSSIVIFEESVAAASGGGILSTDIMPVVLKHEVGHHLGLVNLGTPMVEDHEDPERPGHDVDEDCIMFFAAETSNVADMMLGGAPDFDDACLNDIAARRGDAR